MKIYGANDMLSLEVALDSLEGRQVGDEGHVEDHALIASALRAPVAMGVVIKKDGEWFFSVHPAVDLTDFVPQGFGSLDEQTLSAFKLIDGEAESPYEADLDALPDDTAFMALPVGFYGQLIMNQAILGYIWKLQSMVS